MTWVDSHCHLGYEAGTDEPADRDGQSPTPAPPGSRP